MRGIRRWTNENTFDFDIDELLDGIYEQEKKDKMIRNN